MIILRQSRNVRDEIKISAMRSDWAKAQEKNGTTPALTRFIKESKAERKALRAELATLIRASKLLAAKAKVTKKIRLDAGRSKRRS